MEQKVDRTFLSGESRLEIYKQVLKELRVAYKYNEKGMLKLLPSMELFDNQN